MRWFSALLNVSISMPHAESVAAGGTARRRRLKMPEW
jgi:hypothetical protein